MVSGALETAPIAPPLHCLWPLAAFYIPSFCLGIAPFSLPLVQLTALWICYPIYKICNRPLLFIDAFSLLFPPLSPLSSPSFLGLLVSYVLACSLMYCPFNLLEMTALSEPLCLCWPMLAVMLSGWLGVEILRWSSPLLYYVIFLYYFFLSYRSYNISCYRAILIVFYY